MTTRAFPATIQRLLNDLRTRIEIDRQFEIEYGNAVQRIVPILEVFEERFGAARLAKVERGAERVGNQREPFLRITRERYSAELRYRPNPATCRVEVVVGNEVTSAHAPDVLSDEMIENQVDQFARGTLRLGPPKDDRYGSPSDGG